MKIAVIGGAGKAGGMIVKEALTRGHDVTAIVRPNGNSKVCSGVKTLEKCLFKLSAADLDGFDAVVSAFGTPVGELGLVHLHLEAAQHLIKIFKELPNTRLLIVGGAGSLYKEEGKDERVIEDIPGLYRAIPENQKKALEEFEQSDINWTFFSPAEQFDYKGLRTGEYTLGGNHRILNKVGASYISYADYAVAMVDEIENNKHPKKRFTAVSCDPYFREAKQFFTVEQHMFSRRGAWLALQADFSDYGRGALYLMTNRGGRNHASSKTYSWLYRIFPTFEGTRVPFAIQTAAAEYTLHTRHGDVRFTWADSGKLMAEGDVGMGLLMLRESEPYEIVKPRRDGAWESPVRNSKSLLFKGLEGSSFTFDFTWDFYKFKSDEIRGYTKPNSDGKFTLVIEEFFYTAYTRDKYPSYAEAKASMQADWDEFLSKFAHFDKPYDAVRESVAYTLWSHLVGPSPMTPNWMIMMFPCVIGSQWQHVQNAVALQEHTDLSLELLLAYLNRQGEEGQIADSFDDAFLATNDIKPPVYGWALKNIMAHRDITKCWPLDKIEKLYEGAGRWAEWFMKYRDDDGDGLPAFENGTENGLDEATIWFDQINMTSPDISAYTVLNFEVQGDLAKALGKPDAEVNEWYRKSKELLERMIEKLWDGEHFVALREYTHEPVFTGSVTHYIPLVLGDRLPLHIIEKMASDLSAEGELLTQYGLATERLDSDLFEAQGVQMGRGTIDPPAEVFILTGLWDAGKKDLARMIIDRYCGRLMTGGFSHIIDPISGKGSPFYGTWSRCVFTILCRMISENKEG